MKLPLQTSIALGMASALLIVAGCSKHSDGPAAGAAKDYTASSTGHDASKPGINLREASLSYVSRDSRTNSALNREPDNTGINARDRSDLTLTPGDQGSSDSDRQITAEIRRAITANDQFSTEAKNIKIITINGKVTLRGPVKSAQEKEAIASAAQNVTGVTSFDNQLELNLKSQ